MASVPDPQTGSWAGTRPFHPESKTTAAASASRSGASTVRTR